MQDYRNSFNKLGTSYRSTAAKRIKKLYLSANSAYPVQWPLDVVSPTIEEVLDKLSIGMDNPDVNTFDDIGIMALLSLEKAYHGMFKLPAPENGSTDDFLDFVNFRASPFYQAMRNDLFGTTHITASQYKRAAERVIEMCNTVTMDMGAYENIMVMLEDLALENEYIRQGQKKKQNQITSARSASNLFVEEMSPTTAKSNRGGQYASESTAYHTFIHSKSLLGFCEFCFESSGLEDSRSLYSCESKLI